MTVSLGCRIFLFSIAYVILGQKLHKLVWGDGMSYRIHYQPMRKSRRKEHLHIRRAVLTVLCFSLFLVLVCNLWTDATKLVSEALVALRPAVVVSAMEDMAEAFQEGMSISTAIENFLHNLMQEEPFASG